MFVATLTVAAMFSMGSTQNVIPLVGFFDKSNNHQQEVAFRLTIEMLNNDKTLLQDTILEPVVQYVSPNDSFNISKTICRLSEQIGIGGIFGPQSMDSTGIVNSLSNILALPHMETNLDTSMMPVSYMVNVFPDPHLFAKALLEVTNSMDWKTFTIIYEKDEALIRLQEIFKARSKLIEGHLPFTVYQLSENVDQRPLLKEIRSLDETHIILDCSVDRILDILHQAKEVNLLTEYHSYILTSLDAHTLDYGPFIKLKVNITTLRLVDSRKHLVQAAVQDWIYQEARRNKKLVLSPETVTVDAALMHDAVVMYARALHDYLKYDYIYVDYTRCNDMKPWRYGYALLDRMKKLPFEGMTGKILIDYQTGRRTFFYSGINRTDRSRVQENRSLGQFEWTKLHKDKEPNGKRDFRSNNR